MQEKEFNLNCPIAISAYPHVLLAHGGGGKLMHQLIDQMFRPTFGDSTAVPCDAAVLSLSGNQLALTTDSYVVKPLFFPGGDIGCLAIYGTVNDLAMVGARPLYLSVGFILEEGLEMAVLWQIVQSMQKAAEIAQVKIVTGDTKVVDRGKGDRIFINTTGVGAIEHSLIISPASIQVGDVVLLSGDIGRHGMTIMAQRESLEFESDLISDCAPLADIVLELLAAKIEIHCLRDLTRGGLASGLNEIALGQKIRIEIEQKLIPVEENVRGLCEILGFDPLYVANEGRFIAFLPKSRENQALEIVRSYPQGQNAQIIGKVTNNDRGIVTMKSSIGADRIVDMISGEQLPRIC